MSDTTASLRRKIQTANDLQAVVRTLKTLAAANVRHYDNAVLALEEYYRTVKLSLWVCFQHRPVQAQSKNHAFSSPHEKSVAAIIFGSDQGLVGQFNETLATFAVNHLRSFSEQKMLWTVGERVQLSLLEAQFVAQKSFNVPATLPMITPLIGQLVSELETAREKNQLHHVYLFYNRPQANGVYEAVAERILPPDKSWQTELSQLKWASRNLPEMIGGVEHSLPAVMQEYLFVSLFRACANSLVSENASRLLAMQRAEKNIAERAENLTRAFHQLRQNAIDEELFDVIAGFEAFNA